jgi:hypothetical protein
VPWHPKFGFEILNTKFFAGYNWPPVGSPTQILLNSLMPSGTYREPIDQPGIKDTWDGTGTFPTIFPPDFRPTNWDHLIYAYLLENTRIFDIFCKVLETYMFTEQLETPSPASQLFWRNLEFLIFGEAMPSMVWTTSSRLRRDEIANRLTVYYWMFGLDVSHAPEIAAQHPYQKPAAANRDFIPTVEAFLAEIWRGSVNAKNTSGPNDADSTVIATLARRLFDMMGTRRLNGNLSREEFRAVAIMSFMHLAILFDSPAVVDLKATASSPEMRLQKIAERVGKKTHPRTKPLLDLASPFSMLLQGVETGKFNTPTGAQTLYQPLGTPVAAVAERVIDQYSLATGHDLKAQAVSITPRATTLTVPALKRPAGSASQLEPAKHANKLAARAGQ